ncbi:peroxisomal assembly protein [Coemansia sp. RSA 1939]|nr:peroxisomal assembly protein [Coemansia sp. RSA 1939]KAJ2607804.1 peroxisomal assembly protein [Coemansia sp. RSA 1804]
MEDSLDVTIEPIVAVELSEIVLGVASDQYANALQAQARITDHFVSHTQLWYQGLKTVVQPKDISSGSQNTESSILLTCLMCQPVMYGIVSKGSEPRIVVTKLPTTVSDTASKGPETSNQDACGDTSDDGWDLSAEWFILGDIPLGSGRALLADAAFNDPSLVDKASGLSLENPDRSQTAKSLSKAESNLSVPFTAYALQAPIDVSQVLPTPHANEDIDNRGYISLAASAKTGIISGSWVLIELECKSNSLLSSTADSLEDNAISPRQRQRAIRIFALDSISLNTALMLPPLLFHNVCAAFGQGPQFATRSALRSCEARVLVTPLGVSPDEPSPEYLKDMNDLSYKSQVLSQPPLLVARKVYIARVSSPLSERRELETHALATLEKWLSPPTPGESSDSSTPLRVVKEGDLIAVRVSLADAVVRTSVAKFATDDASSRVRNNGEETEFSAVDVNPVTDLALEHLTVNHKRLYSRSSVSENELVFYQVVTVEGFKRTAEDYALPYTLKSTSRRDHSDMNEDEEASENSEYESDYYSSDEEFDYNSSKAASSDKKWAVWYHQVNGRGFIVLPQITMVVQAGSVHNHVPYQTMRKFALSPTQSPRSDPKKPGDSDRASAINVPYARVQEQLIRLGSASLHPLAITHKLVSGTLLKGNTGTGKRHMVRAVADTLGVHLYELSCYEILSDTEDKTAQILKMYFEHVSRYTPCILHLRNIDALALSTNAPPGQENPDDLSIARVLEACIADTSRVHCESGFPVVVVGTSSQADKLPASLASVFRHEIELSVPDEQTRLSLLRSMAEDSLQLSPDADLAYIAQQTASFVARDLAMLIKRAEKHALQRAYKQGSASSNRSSAEDVYSRSPMLIRSLALSGQVITHDDLLGALSEARSSISDTLGVPKIPNVKWDDVGGLADAKRDILDTIRLPMEQPHLFESGLNTRSGLLFYGPPGTGKTLLAKAIATECGLNFFSCKGPELISPYIGESEANVRRIFQKAREASPCVVFFDELDSLAPKRGQQGDSGGVMDRIVSQLLAELDGMSGGSSNDDDDNGKESKDDSKPSSNSSSSVQVFAIGATNRPDLLDPALLRPGRFDKLVYLGVSETHEAQLNIIQALTRKFHLHPDLDLRNVADQCPFHYTGADFYALCSDALLKAMLRTIDEVDILVSDWNEGKRPVSVDTMSQSKELSIEKHYPTPMTPQYYLDHIADDSVKQVTVTLNDFAMALDELVPSVSAEELQRYQALRQQFDSALKEKEKERLKGKNHEPAHDTSMEYIYTQEGSASDEQLYASSESILQPHTDDRVIPSLKIHEQHHAITSPSVGFQAETPSDSTSMKARDKKNSGKGKEPEHYSS